MSVPIIVILIYSFFVILIGIWIFLKKENQDQQNRLTAEIKDMQKMMASGGKEGYLYSRVFGGQTADDLGGIANVKHRLEETEKYLEKLKNEKIILSIIKSLPYTFLSKDEFFTFILFVFFFLIVWGLLAQLIFMIIFGTMEIISFLIFIIASWITILLIYLIIKLVKYLFNLLPDRLKNKN